MKPTRTNRTLAVGSRVLAVQGRPGAMNPNPGNVGHVGNVLREINDGAGQYYEVQFGPGYLDHVDRECLVLLPLAGGAA